MIIRFFIYFQTNKNNISINYIDFSKDSIVKISFDRNETKNYEEMNNKKSIDIGQMKKEKLISIRSFEGFQ
jgi:hypothetical protein